MKMLALSPIGSTKIIRVLPREVLDFYECERQKLLHRYRKIVDYFGISGTVLLQLFRDGDLIDARVGENLVVTTGKNAVIDRLQGTSVGVHDFQAVGTGTTDPALGDTALETEIGTRVQGTLSQPTALTDRLVSTFAAANGTGALTETGRLTASSGGNLFSRIEFAVVNKGASDSLVVTHDITVS